MTDTFNGDNAKLIDAIEALLDLDAQGALVPHGVGGHARTMLASAAVRLARQPAAIDKDAVTPVRIADAERAAYKVSGHRAGEKWTKAFAEALLATPLAKEASKPAAPSVEQDERVAFDRAFQLVFEAYSAPRDRWNTDHGYILFLRGKVTEAFSLLQQVRAASTSANGDRFDPYRLKVAEECCERLMSACTDAGCPDGVRMDDWIRENIPSTSANVAQGADWSDRELNIHPDFKPFYAPFMKLWEAQVPTGDMKSLCFFFYRHGTQTTNVAQSAEAVVTVKVYETYTGQNGWIEVTQEEYDRTKDKYEHRIRRVPAPPAQTGNKRD